LNKKTLAVICLTSCLIPNVVGAVQLELGTERERKKRVRTLFNFNSTVWSYSYTNEANYVGNVKTAGT